LLDVSGGRFYSLGDSGAVSKLAMTTMQNISHAPWVTWSPRDAARVIAAMQAALPPAAPPVFIWNRALFLCAAVLLVVLTTRYVGRQRRGRA